MRRRTGFTITELLVAMALIVFVMSILATAFSAGMKTFHDLKGIGDMNRRLDLVTALLEDDLQAPHFEGNRRLSDANFWTTTQPAEFGPPREGFFRIWQGSPVSATNPAAPYYLEGTDSTEYNIPSLRAVDHSLHFTTRKRGTDPKQFYRAGVPAGSPLLSFGNYRSRFQDEPAVGTTFNSQWAEIAWFLRPVLDASGQQANANGQPLYTLYRRQRVIVPNPQTGGSTNLNYPSPGTFTNLYNNLINGTNYLNVSCRSGPKGEFFFNSPSDLTVPQHRFGMNPASYGGLPARADGSYPIFQPANSAVDPANPDDLTNPNLQGADAVITDVVSFVIRIRTSPTGNFIDVPASSATTGNPLFAKAAGPFVFDTWTTNVDDQVDYSLWNVTTATTTNSIMQVRPPQKGMIINAIQIQLRVWDSKTEQARQMTLVIDM